MQGATAIAGLRVCKSCRASYRDSSLRVCPKDGKPLVVWRDDPLLGQVLGGQYQIVEPLGQGGMGAVYIAERLSDEKQVAVKVVRPEHVRDETVQERFLREVVHTTRIESPYVVRIFDSGKTEDGRVFMVMELLRGQSLTQKIRSEHPLPALTALAIARDMALGLEAAHSAQIVHRDLKPDNIFLCRNGRLKVLDLGIAKAFAPADTEHFVDEPSLTAAHRVVGTPVYMAPELISKEELVPASDLYALGVILYEMLVGEPPFKEENPVSTMYRHLHDKPRRLREVQPDMEIPGALETLVGELLEKSPDKRPQKASDVVQRLDALIDLLQAHQLEYDTGDLTRVYDPTESQKIALAGLAKENSSSPARLALMVVGAFFALVVGFALTAFVLYFSTRPAPIDADVVQLPSE